MSKRTFKHLGVDKRRKVLEEECERLELQIWALERDIGKWKQVHPESLRAREIDDQVVGEAAHQKKLELAKAEYNLELAEMALADAESALEDLSPKAVASVNGAGSQGDNG